MDHRCGYLSVDVLHSPPTIQIGTNIRGRDVVVHSTAFPAERWNGTSTTPERTTDSAPCYRGGMNDGTAASEVSIAQAVTSHKNA